MMGAYNYKRDNSMQVKYFGGSTKDALIPGYNYNSFSNNEMKLKKNNNKKYELTLDLKYPKLMGTEMDPDDTPFTAAGFFIQMNA
jgi:hypothetical protein